MLSGLYPLPVFMPFINFTKAELRGPAVDQATTVAETANLQVRLYTEVGNGDDGNGGADGALGFPYAGEISFAGGFVNASLFSLRETQALGGPVLPDTEVVLRLRMTPSVERYPGSKAPLYFDLVMAPMRPRPDFNELEEGDFLPLHHYAFSHTFYLPGRWVDRAFDAATDIATPLAAAIRLF